MLLVPPKLKRDEKLNIGIWKNGIIGNIGIIGIWNEGMIGIEKILLGIQKLFIENIGKVGIVGKNACWFIKIFGTDSDIPFSLCFMLKTSSYYQL